MKDYKVTQNETFYDVRIIFRNFKGAQSPYNKTGKRTFDIVLTEEQANDLQAKGWNAKMRAPREEGEAPLWHIPVEVSYTFRAPIVIVAREGSNKTVRLDEQDIERLDTMDIVSCDVTIRPYNWQVREESGVKAYLDTLAVTIRSNPLVEKYESNNVEEEDVNLPFDV